MIRTVVSFSVHRQWLVVLLTIAAAVFGAWSWQRLPIDAVPDITNNQVQINTTAPALSPADIEKQVTYPIETALAGIRGLEYTRSLSRNGFSQVTAVFSEKLDVYFARQQVSERLGEVKTNLPPGAEVRLGPVSTGLGEIYMWSVRFKPFDANASRPDEQAGWRRDGRYLTPEGQVLSNDIERAAYVRTVQDWIIRPQLKNVGGVAGVDTIGGHVKHYHVQPDPLKMSSLSLSFSDVAEAIERSNANRGAGYVERNGEAYVVRAPGRLQGMEDIAGVVIATRGGVPVRVRDVAEVKIGGELRTGSASENGEEVVIGTALMLIGGNSRTVAAGVDQKLKEIARSLPPDIEIKTLLNRTLLVDATIHTVFKNLAEGALLVILVLFVLLGNFRAALITAFVIPITMLLTAVGMMQGRISANLMSLGALDFGLIVDGAVIIAENSLRHIAERQRSLGRVLNGNERAATVIASAEEMIRPSVYGQAIIILVYAPLLTFTGVEGKMFEPMALTVIIALAIAFVVSLTFVPAAIALLVSTGVQDRENWAIAAMKRAYKPVLGLSLRRPLAVAVSSVLLFGLSLIIFSRLGQEFIPTLDEKNFSMHAVRVASTALSQSQRMQIDVENAIRAFPQVAGVFSKTGTAEIASDPMPPNTSDTFVILRPPEEWPARTMTKAELINSIQKAVEQLPGNNYEFTQPIQMRFNELLAGTRADLAVKVFGEDFSTMLPIAEKIAAILRETIGAHDVRVEQAIGLPSLEVAVDKNELGRFGLGASVVQDVIGAAIGGREAGAVFEGDRRFPITVRLADSLREDLESLKNLPVPLPSTGAGRPPQILLRQVATFAMSEGANQISRENGRRRVVVTANVRGRDIASVVSEAQSKVTAQVQVPPGSWITWGGQFENLIAAQQRLMLVVPGCFLLIFLLLYSALGSARDATLVFSAVPMALIGGVAALWVRDMPFSVSAAVGFIALSGVAVLNGLVMLTYIHQLRRAGRDKSEAVSEGALTRLRPVVMTALVASLGFVPMALATGTGAEVQRPLATVVIGGLLTATLLTLVVLPSLYARFGAPVPSGEGNTGTRSLMTEDA
jgi:cobalt-zinc-cadmium resistance protein CzcA